MFVFWKFFFFRLVYSDLILIPSEWKLLVGIFSVGKRRCDCFCPYFPEDNNSLFFEGLATNGIRERRENNGTPKNTLLETEVEERARLVVETSQVMRSLYCQTNSRRLYLPAGMGIADLYREFKGAIEANTKILSYTWFYQFMGKNYNIGTHRPKNDR